MYASSGLDLEVPPVAVPLLAAAAAAAETIHLGHETTRVPESLLEPPIENDRRRVTVDLAAFLLDRHLRRLVAMRNPLELRLARLLGRLENSTGPLELGFARLSDYVIERLGISVRRMVDLLKMDRRLVELPRSAEAFASGRITTCQLRALLRVATPETESGWLEKAARLNVRLLEREVRSALGREGAAGGAGDAGTAPRGAVDDAVTPPRGAAATPPMTTTSNRARSSTSSAPPRCVSAGAGRSSSAADRPGRPSRSGAAPNTSPPIIFPGCPTFHQSCPGRVLEKDRVSNRTQASGVNAVGRTPPIRTATASISSRRCCGTTKKSMARVPGLLPPLACASCSPIPCATTRTTARASST